jgi:SRSO17 transposase
VATSRWDTCTHERVLLEKADALVGGRDAHLIIDDTALVKKGEHSVGVAHQYCGQLGKGANCQALVSPTLARDEMPVPVALRLYLPKAWAQDQARRRKWNRNPTPFAWTKPAAAIIKSHRRMLKRISTTVR